MKKSRFSETQIVSILKEAEAGLKVDDVCRKHGISTGTYYNWKSKDGGLSVSEIKRVKELEAENAKLKRMYADLAIENDAIKDLLEKKPWSRQNWEALLATSASTINSRLVKPAGLWEWVLRVGIRRTRAQLIVTKKSSLLLMKSLQEGTDTFHSYFSLRLA